MVSDKKIKAKEKGNADGIKVYCCFDKIVNVKDLVPNPKNPNKHPKEQIEKLAFVIKNNGWRSPITVSNRSGMIVKGHGRLEAALFLKVNSVPVDYQDYDSDNAENADLLADNRIAELSEEDNRKILALLEECDAGDIDIELTGFSDEDYRDLTSQFDEFCKKDEEETEPTARKTVVCPHCGMEVKV